MTLMLLSASRMICRSGFILVTGVIRAIIVKSRFDNL